MVSGSTHTQVCAALELAQWLQITTSCCMVGFIFISCNADDSEQYFKLYGEFEILCL